MSDLKTNSEPGSPENDEYRVVKAIITINKLSSKNLFE